MHYMHVQHSMSQSHAPILIGKNQILKKAPNIKCTFCKTKNFAFIINVNGGYQLKSLSFLLYHVYMDINFGNYVLKVIGIYILNIEMNLFHLLIRSISVDLNSVSE